MRKRVLVCSLILLMCAPALAQRNIVFILIDDQRYDAIGRLQPFFETPHLDALMQNGVFFENAFVTTSLCSPSRASFLSGQWAHKHGVLNNSTPLAPDTPTFPKELQRAGYKTAFVGKWHMGGSSDAPRPGFDRWVSFRGQGVYFNPTFNVDGDRVRRDGYTTDLITEYAEEFLDQEHDAPFMLYVSHKAVHANFEPAPRHKGAYEGRRYPFPASMADTEENYRGKPEWVRAQRNTWHGVDGLYDNRVDLEQFTLDYAETLKAVDDSVGRIVAKLNARGLLDSTLLVFTSDNGFQFGEHGLIDKRTMYEASIRVPLIVHCPDLFEGGQRRKQMVLNTDFNPTFLEAAGIDVPKTVQGESFWGMLNDGSRLGREAFVYTYFWERSFPQTPTVLGLRTDRYKLMKFHGTFDRYELYDLENDPHENNNLIAALYTTTEAGNVEARIRTATSARYRERLGEDVDPEALKKLFQSLNTKLNQELQRIECALSPTGDPRPPDKPIANPAAIRYHPGTLLEEGDTGIVLAYDSGYERARPRKGETEHEPQINHT